MSFTRKFESKSVCSDEDMVVQDLVTTYMLLYTKWEEAYMIVKNRHQTISVFYKEKEDLVSTITDLEEEVSFLNSKMDNTIKYVSMLKNGSIVLDEILEIGKMSRNMKRFGFDSNLNNKIPTKKVVLPKREMDHMS